MVGHTRQIGFCDRYDTFGDTQQAQDLEMLAGLRSDTLGGRNPVAAETIA